MRFVGRSNRINCLLALGVIAALTFVVFSPSLRNGFVTWDDDYFVVNNAAIKSLSLASVQKIFSSVFHDLYIPFTLLTFQLEYHFIQLDPFFYHLTNLALHLFNTLFVFALMFLLTRRCLAAFVAAILFGVHPMHVESVAWVSERKDVLYAFFLFASLIAYLQYARSRSWKAYLFSFLAFACSLLSKPMAILLPFMLWLMDYFVGRPFNRKTIGEKIPFILLAAIAAAVNLLHVREAMNTEGTLSLSWDGFLVACHGLLGYGFKLLWPVSLSCFYPYPAKIGGVFPWTYVFAPFGVAILFFVVLWTKQITKKVFFAASFFLLMILPVLPLAPKGPGVAMADRYVYVASVGFFYLLAELFVFFWDRAFRHRRFVRGLLAAVLATLVSLWGVLTFERTKVWRDGVTLWKDALVQEPDLATAHLNLAYAYLDQNKTAPAFRHAEEALRLGGDDWDVYVLLGNLFFQQKDFSKAKDYYRKTLRFFRPDRRAYALFNNLGNIYVQEGPNRDPQAVFYYQQASILDPSAFEPLFNLGMIYKKQGKPGEALSYFRRASVLNPDYEPALQNALSVLVDAGLWGEALQTVEKLILRNPSNIATLLNLGVIFASLGEFEQAEAAWRQVLRLDPDSFPAKQNLELLQARTDALNAV